MNSHLCFVVHTPYIIYSIDQVYSDASPVVLTVQSADVRPLRKLIINQDMRVCLQTVALGDVHPMRATHGELVF